MLEIEKKNTGRQFELDIARGFAVIFMVMIHTVLSFSNSNIYDTTYGKFADFVGGIPAAPVFMFLLGVGLIYMRNSNPKILIRRGGILFASGYLLNILRGILPGIWLLNFSPEYMELGGSEKFQFLYGTLLNVDILQFAGLAFIFFGIMKYFKVSIKGYYIAFIVACLATTFFHWLIPLTEEYNSFAREDVVTSHVNVFIDPILSLFTGNIWLSYFAFFPWILYPIAGYIFGSKLIQTESKRKFYTKTLIASMLFGIIFSIFVMFGIFTYGYETDGQYYHHSFMTAFFYISFVLMEISVFYFLSPYIKGIFRKFLESSSKYVSDIYFIHWVTIGILTTIIASGTLSLWSTIGITILIYAFSHFLSIRYRTYQKKKREMKKMIKV